jgi:hypothetical protein
MGFQMAKTIWQIVSLVLLASATGAAVVAAGNPCAGAPKYHVAPNGGHAASTNNPWTLYLQISVPPEAISKDDLVLLACKLRRDFAKEVRLHVWIFTDPEAAKQFTFDRSSPSYHKYLGKLRGSYYIDRDKREQSLKFSNDPQNPEDMRPIDLPSLVPD